ncbi:MAG: hypothetical protein BRC29_03770 [Nanohaloarchaea archaeon SW_7_43_1]|nr:MAG: hypothetical protein BRC29_03770 [Nanohaloarchaea archaeon SW_7_43_1]
MKKDFRNKLTSICRETAKTLKMDRDGARWFCETTELNIKDEGKMIYRFYVMDKNSGHEYQVNAVIEKDDITDWNVREVTE